MANPVWLETVKTVYDDVKTRLGTKVDKVSGKGLSSNDYTNTAKAKVDAIPADPKYTDTLLTEQDILNMGFSKGNGNNVSVDATLTLSGKAADAKVTGDRFTTINENLNQLRQDFDNADFGSGNGMTNAQAKAICDWLTEHVPMDVENADSLYQLLTGGQTDEPEEPTTNPVSVSWSGTTATVNNLNNLTASYSGTVATIGA